MRSLSQKLTATKKKGSLFSAILPCFFVLLALVLTALPAAADVGVKVAGPAGSNSQTLPGDSGTFDMTIPLAKNTVNKLTVTATDENGNKVSQNISLTQISFDSLVVAQVTATPLPPSRIEELVNDGTINISDPDNFNVSQFSIVLTIGGVQQIPVNIPVSVPKNEEPTGYEVYKFPQGDGGGNGTQDSPPIEIIVFEARPSGPPGVSPPSIPGVIVIDGRIKTLKEFYSVKFLMLNTSGIFTLKDVSANLEFPNGGLSNILPVDGIGALGDITPGEGGLPGQAQKEFIIRGDDIGIKPIRVSFGGKVAGPGIADGEEIPFNGSAETSVEVKGPPKFTVRVTHPDAVVANIPYDLEIDITNSGDTPALYTSLDLDVGFDARLLECALDNLGDPVCTEIQGPAKKSFGHILPGQTVRGTFTVKPLATGGVTSCMGIADQNITLQVSVSNIGCLVGQFSPDKNNPDGKPAVSILPGNNFVGVALEAPVTAFFSKPMRESSITTGANGTFNVYDKAGVRQPGELRFATLNGDTVVVWQFKDGITNRLSPDTEYLVEVLQTITDVNGRQLYSQWKSSFTTTGDGIDDFDSPIVTMGVEPPVSPNNVIPGQVAKVSVYPTDQGSGIRRVELRIKDLSLPDDQYKLIDQKKYVLGDKFPYFFTIDSKNLIAGHTYQLRASAYDGVGNIGETTLALQIATVAPIPTITLPTPDPAGILRGKPLSLTPVAVTGGTFEVSYFIDAEVTPFKTVNLIPYQAVIPTKDLSVGVHTITAVARDGLSQTGQAVYQFEVLENTNAPTVTISSPVSNQQVVTGTVLPVQSVIEDVTGITSIKWYFDNPSGAPFAQNVTNFGLNTTGLPLGSHTIYVVATNSIGLSTLTSDASTFRTFEIVAVPPEPAPGAPSITNITTPNNGETIVTGTTAPNRRVDVKNTAFSTMVSVLSNAAGVFTAPIAGESGNGLEVIAFNAAQNLSSPAALGTVPAAPTLDFIEVSPTSRTFNSFADFQDLVVTAHYVGGGTANVTSTSTFSSANTAAVGVSASGRVAPLANGSSVVTASFGGKSATANITVSVVVLQSISADPSGVSFTSPGQTQQLTVTGHFSNGTTQDLTSGTSYQTGNPAVASVNFAGLISAVGHGSTTVTVFRSGVAPVTVNVNVNLADANIPTASITSPANGADFERGQTVNVAVHAEDVGTGVTKLHLSTSGQATVTDLKQFSATTSTNQVFSFVVPATAIVGGTIQVAVTAEDAVGNLSSVASITLDVVDVTAPTVTITSPLSQQGFNFGDVVTVSVQTSDSVGVSQIRYTAEGALSFNGVQNFTPTPGQRLADFQFTVPFGVASPDVRIRAYAKDAFGNEKQAAPVDILITDADITAPETVATNVSAPSGATTTINYEVTDGLADLDYVALFFRRNGIGTFNRYTNAVGGNAEGKFFPSSGNSGTIVFDSTRMGGDGDYEFYTVGVDVAGNREADPMSGVDILPDQTLTINSGAAVTEINATTTISSSNFSFDNLNLRLTGNITVTVDGAHTFRNVELLNGAKLVHTAATPTTEPNLILTVWSLSIDASSSIDLSGLGYRGGLNSGNTSCSGLTVGNTLGAAYRSGGSYGGTGAVFSGGVTNPIYGSLADPLELGSGGSCGGSFNIPGGNGGGRVTINAINLANNGLVVAHGQNSQGGFQAGNGSGGGIKISASTVSGSGFIRSNGSSPSGGNSEVGGGGGRIAIYFLDVSTLDRSKVQALGGIGGNGIGGNGTVFFSGIGESNGTLIIDGQGAGTPFSPILIPSGFTFDNITVRNNARVIIDSPLSITGTFAVLNNSIVTHSVGLEAGLVINADKILVDATSLIDVTSRGYRGGLNSGNAACTGQTLGGIPGATFRSGGSYGGRGGIYDGSGSSKEYGDIKNPTLLGSGGSCGGSFNIPGGNGGGRIELNASQSVQVDGAIRADGQNSQGGFQAGNGSGGSIKITTSNLKGTGAISANGQAVSGGNNEVGGGGGRIAIFYDFLGVSGNDLNATRSITAFGSKSGNRNGSAGSLYMRRSDQQDGELYLDEVMGAGQTSGVVIPLGTQIGFGVVSGVTADTLTTDGKVALVPNGLVGLVIQPNIEVDQTYTIISNTSSTITVDTFGKPALTSVAADGDTYVGVLQFDNVIFRRGAFAMLGDKLIVNNLLDVAENSWLSHYDATLTFTSKLDIEAGIFNIAADSRVDVSARGYLAGLSSGNPSCTGSTIPSLAGATYRSGGSHGGFGGKFDAGVSNALYGSISDPVELGSGGSCGGSFNVPGGDGGGAVRIVAGDLVVDGELAANGARVPNGFLAGNGSGGSINLSVGTLSGTGFIRANGDTALFGGFSEVGGGGGRIAVRYNVLSLPQANIQTLGGISNNSIGGQGTIFFKGPGQALGDLVIDGAGINSPDDLSSLPIGVSFDNIILRNKARVVLTAPLVTTGTLQLLNESRLTHPIGDEDGIQITADSVFVDSTSAIDATARGYQGGLNSGNSSCTGITLGGQLGSVYRSGGSYGGVGGVYEGSGSNPVYGVAEEPIYLGSGGSCGGSSNVAGGNGGGRIQIVAENDVLVNGVLRADGQNSVSGFLAGNGSGGSVLIDADNISGTGTLSANGFAQSLGFSEVGGGGGRIALIYNSFGGVNGDFNGTLDITAFGGHSNNRAGSAGTVYYRNKASTLGDVIFDEGLASGTSSIASTFTRVGFGAISSLTADTIGFDLTRRVTPGGLVGVTINPNLAQSEKFVIIANTDTQATVDNRGIALTSLAANGDSYAAVHRYKNVTLRRGALLEMDDQLVVDGTLLVSDRSMLTHRATDLSLTSRLDVNADVVTVDATSRIDVSTRGYVGGLQSGNGCAGRTLGNLAGSTYRSGGSFGGLGGIVSGGVPNAVYGSATSPAALGSGGSCGASFNVPGGNGGGWFKGVFGSLNLNGFIAADGQNSPNGFQAGNGSGGTINLSVGSLVGAGTIRANGFSPTSGFSETGGGGGRVAIRYNTQSFTGATQALAGPAGAQVGSVVFEQN